MKITISDYTVDDKRRLITELIEKAGSQFITVEFIKKDKSNRKMNIQQESLKYHVKGDEASESAKQAVKTRKENNPNLMAVYDVQEQEIRSINLDTTHTVRTNHDVYVFI